MMLGIKFLIWLYRTKSRFVWHVRRFSLKTKMPMLYFTVNIKTIFRFFKKSLAGVTDVWHVRRFSLKTKMPMLCFTVNIKTIFSFFKKSLFTHLASTWQWEHNNSANVWLSQLQQLQVSNRDGASKWICPHHDGNTQYQFVFTCNKPINGIYSLSPTHFLTMSLAHSPVFANIYCAK